MNEDIAAQLIGCTTAAAAWAAVNAMYGAQNSAGIRHLRRQIQALRKEDKPAAEYMQKVKGIADAMAAAGSPLCDDEIIDYMLTGLGKAFNPIAASMNFSTVRVTLAMFYNNVLNFEALQKQQEEDGDWTSSANAVSRPGYTTNTGRGGRPAGGSTPPAQGGQFYPGQGGSGYGGQGGQGFGDQGQDRRRNGGGNDGGNGRNGGGGNGRNRRWRPQCQI